MENAGVTRPLIKKKKMYFRHILYVMYTIVDDYIIPRSIKFPMLKPRK